VLFFPGISTIAIRVYGRLGNFTSATENNGGVSASSLYFPNGLHVDASGVYIADHSNNRIFFFSSNFTVASRVYGQFGSFLTNKVNNATVSASSLSFPTSVFAITNGVYIADSQNNRVLVYSKNSTVADCVYGQHGFESSLPNSEMVSASSLWSLSGVFADASGTYIADSNNNRVLFYSGGSVNASRVYGQPGNFSTNAPNLGGISANTLSMPNSIAVDSSGVYIGDSGNNRVLFYPVTSTTATQVYGQPNFVSNVANNGGISRSSLDRLLEDKRKKKE
jgi:hypothetical protein